MAHGPVNRHEYQGFRNIILCVHIADKSPTQESSPAPFMLFRPIVTVIQCTNVG